MVNSKARRTMRLAAILKQAVCVLLSLAVVAPLYLVLINSFKTKS